METKTNLKIDRIFKETFPEIPKKQHWKVRIWIIIIVILMSGMVILMRYNYKSLTIGLFFVIILVILFVSISSINPKLKNKNIEKLIFLKNGQGIISFYSLSDLNLENNEEESFYLKSSESSLLEPVIIMNKKNVEYVYLIDKNEETNKFSFNNYSKKYFEKYFMKDKEKTVCIEFKNPITQKKFWYHRGKTFPDLEKVYISVDEPEKLIKYLKKK